MEKLTPEQYVQMQKIGQETLNRMTDQIQDVMGVIDVTIPISLCMSMTAHYISGIPDKRARTVEILKFASNLTMMVEYLAEESEPGKKSNVTMIPDGEPN